MCEKLNVKDAYFHDKNDLFFEFMASMAVLSVVAVCCASAYISRADGQACQSFGNDKVSSVRFGQNQFGFGRVLSGESRPDPTSTVYPVADTKRW